MSKRKSVLVACVGVLSVGAGVVMAGPDVIVGDVTGPSGPRKWGTINGVTAYSIGTTSCNLGDTDLRWIQFGTFHPVIGQAMYRLKDGRFEQIGLSWLKHTFCALQETLCGSCDPVGPFCESALGPGCSDPYSSSLNGDQSGLGPRFQVNAATGEFVWPFATRGQRGDVLFKRLQVAMTDLDPALNPGAVYFAEGQYISPDDAGIADDNNASYRKVRVDTLTSSGYNLRWVGVTKRTAPAISAWQDSDPSVDLLPVDVPGDGRFIVGSKVTDNGDGTWNYEYAIQNLNSDRSVGQVSIPLPSGVTITNIGFHDVDYHSGEPFDGTDWTMSQDSTQVAWSSPETFAQNPDSNALRWGTTYNYRFTANTPPEFGDAIIGLFKPGTPASLTITTSVPSAGGCPADIDGDGDADVADFFAFVTAFAAGDMAADLNGDGMIDVSDFFAFVAAFAVGC